MRWISVDSGIFPEVHSQHGRTFESDEVVVYTDGEKFITRYIKEYDLNLSKVIWEGWLLVLNGELSHSDITHWIDIGTPSNNNQEIDIFEERRLKLREYILNNKDKVREDLEFLRELSEGINPYTKEEIEQMFVDIEKKYKGRY
jgi:hypothetical protein